MKNLKKVAEQSKRGYTPLYYSPKDNAVYTNAGGGRFHITDLIRENTEAEIKQTVMRFMSL